MQLCLNRVTLNPDTTGAQTIRAAHKAGFRFVDISARRLIAALEEDFGLRDMIREDGITPVHGGWSTRLSWDRKRFSRSLDAVAAEMDVVTALGSRSGGLVLPRKRPQDGTVLISRQELMDRVRQVATVADERGLNVVIEFNGLHQSDPPDCGYRTLPQTLELVREIDMKNVGVLLDSYHWHASGASVGEVMNLPPDLPLFIHLNDAPPISPDLLEDSMRLLPGKGRINLLGLLGALVAREYKGALSIELKNPDLHARDPFDAARLAHAAGVHVLEALTATSKKAGGHDH